MQLALLSFIIVIQLGMNTRSGKRSASAITLIILMIFSLSASCDLGNDSELGAKKSIIKFKDNTFKFRLENFSPSFGAVFADIDNDGDDDLIVSNHGRFTPSIYLNEKNSFQDVSHLFQLELTRDWHGIAVVDLDNDGDLDITIAGGGGGGVQEGAPNLLFRNLLIETGNLAFNQIAGKVGLIRQKWRGRHFLPVGSDDGSAVDLYFLCKPRESLTNVYFRNASKAEDIVLKTDNSYGLNIQLEQEGRGDCFFDFDRDGDRDLFLKQKDNLVVYENINGRFYRNNTYFVDIDMVETFKIGDLNKDGYPDLYVGTKAKKSGSDNVSFGIIEKERRLHFVVNNNNDDSLDSVNFKSKSSEIHIYFITGKGLSKDDPSDIYIGKNKLSPRSRIAWISASMAKGKPQFSNPGTYLWNDGQGQWSIVWLYNKESKEERGAITADSIYDIKESMLEEFPRKEAFDRILINQQGAGFAELETIELKHFYITRAVAIEDFNNDGWPDIIGIRGNEPGTYNGEPFVILNCGICNDSNLKLKCQKRISLKNKEDDIAQADQMVVGFVNGDGLPDLFITNAHL